MNPNKPPPNHPAAIPGDPLSLLELSVAKRADELARIGGAGSGTDLVYWLRAEREIFEDASAPGEDDRRLAGR
jgi:hypothetical protein